MGSNYSLIIAPPLYGVNLYCLVVAALPSICAATSKTTKESHIALIAAITGIVALHFKMQGIRAYLAQQFIAEHLLNIEKKRRSRKGKKYKKRLPLYPGPGVWDDYASLFDNTHPFWASLPDDNARAEYREYLEEKFQADFRLSTRTWSWLYGRIKNLLVNTDREFENLYGWWGLGHRRPFHWGPPN